MNPPQDHPQDLPSPPEDWIPLASYHSFSAADDHALVLVATGHECWIHPQDSSFLLFVPSSAEVSARNEITAYETERLPSAPPAPSVEFHHRGTWIIHLWLLSQLVTFACQTAAPSITERFLSSSHALFLQHQWWRPFTALFLHSDFPHLLGNLLGGALFGSLVVRSIGPFLGISAILASGTLGNTINAFLHLPDDHRSLGASTAVFAALGILAALGTCELLRNPRSLPWRRILAPLFGGLILLGWMGGGTPDSLTDVGAHLAGFLSGLALGQCVWLKRPSRR